MISLLEKNLLRRAGKFAKKQLVFRKRRKKFLCFSFEEFNIFLNKYYGMFIFRGKKSFSIKMFDFLFLKLKKKFKKNAYKMLLKIINKIMPVVMVGTYKSRFRNYNAPILVGGNRKNVILLDFVFRQFKNRSNIYGVKKEDILKNLVDVMYNKGLIIRKRRSFIANVLKYKYFLRRSRRRRKIVNKYMENYRNLENKFYNFILLQRHFIKEFKYYDKSYRWEKEKVTGEKKRKRRYERMKKINMHFYGIIR